MLTPENLLKLSSFQSQIWQTISTTVSASLGATLSFTEPEVDSPKTTDLYAEIGAPMLAAQFSFSALPENPMVILLPQETIGSLAEAATGNLPDEVDESTVSDVRGIVESMVQGICVSTGALRNETIAASDLVIRFQIFSFPPNMQATETLVRTKVAVAGDGFTGSLIWLFDSGAATFILNQDDAADEAEILFPQVQEGGIANIGADDPNGLDRLRDIPLEISVELGRVKMLVKDVVDLGAGSIVEIEKSAGEPVDVLVNGRLVARGEVVVIEDNFGVRITEVLSQQDRINRLNEVA